MPKVSRPKTGKEYTKFMEVYGRKEMNYAKGICDECDKTENKLGLSWTKLSSNWNWDFVAKLSFNFNYNLI